MSNEEKEQQFKDKLKNCSLRIFLKSSPYNSGERSSLDKLMTVDRFYSSLYANSNSADALVSDIQEQIKKDDTHNFILTGYKGCGKSTFVGYYLRETNKRSIVISFDDKWEPEVGIKYNIAMCLINKLFDDLKFTFDNKNGKISREYLSIFLENDNSEYIYQNIDDQNYFKYFSEKLIWAIRLLDKQQKEDLKNYLNNDIKMHIMSGRITQMMELLVFWDIADRYANNLSTDCCIVFENLDVIYNTTEVPQLVESIVAFRNNIDILSEKLFYKGEIISDPTQDYILLMVMRETTKAEFSNCIDHFSDKKIRFKTIMYMSNVYDLYDIIKRRCNYLIELSEYPEFRNSEDFNAMLSNIIYLKELLNDNYIRKNVFALFNNDYRTCIEALVSLNLAASKFVDVKKELVRKNSSWAIFGYRSFVFRNIFNMFVTSKYFSMVRRYDYSVNENGKVRSINIARMILVYLNNSTDMLAPPELKEKEYISLYVLFSEMLKICAKPDVIVDALWKMYDLRKEDKWNHLVTFDDMITIEKEQLSKAMDAVVNNTKDYQFSQVKITFAGELYLTYILPHFEYYCARSENGRGESLFTYNSESLCNVENVSKIVMDTRNEIQTCLSQLYLFDRDVLDNISEFSGSNFLESKFASTRYSEKNGKIIQMYHGEKVIYSCINYIDSFRFYVFFMMDSVLENGGFNIDVDLTKVFQLLPKVNIALSDYFKKVFVSNENGVSIIAKSKMKYSNSQMICFVKDDKVMKNCRVNLHMVIDAIKVCYNYILTNEIVEYMRLFGFNDGDQSTMYSALSNDICLLFDACISLKIIPSEYRDFETEINSETGDKLLKN